MKINKNSFLSLSLIASLFVSYLTIAQTSDWVRLGSRRVNYGPDIDVLPLEQVPGTFTAIKIEVRQGAVDMHRCIVFFENGGQQEIEIRNNFKRGSESRVIDLKGNERRIEKIAFKYDTKNRSNNRAIVTVWGKR